MSPIDLSGLSTLLPGNARVGLSPNEPGKLNTTKQRTQITAVEARNTNSAEPAGRIKASHSALAV